jgi:hypothetical protein
VVVVVVVVVMMIWFFTYGQTSTLIGMLNYLLFWHFRNLLRPSRSNWNCCCSFYVPLRYIASRIINCFHVGTNERSSAQH